MIKISIITVCYNSEKYIEKTIKSVVNQTYPYIEYIIVDGMSKDSTPEIISHYSHFISKYVREKDKNMYDAINKGIEISTGDYIEILNSDDCFVDNYVIENVVNNIKKFSGNYDVFYGNDIILYEEDNIFKRRPRIQTSYKELLCSRQLAYTGHGSIFVSRRVCNSIGDYDCDNFCAAADYDYVLRALKVYKCKHIKVNIQVFRVHKGSITSSGKIRKEIEDVLQKNDYYSISKTFRAYYFYKGWIKFCCVNFIPMMIYYLKKMYRSYE